MHKRLSIALPACLMVVAAAVPVLGATGGLGLGDTVRWTGAAPGLGVIGGNDQLPARYGEAPECNPVTCDVQEIQVADPGELVVSAADGNGDVEVDVFRPDAGSLAHRAGGLHHHGDGADARPGRYLVQVTTNQSIDRGGAFRAAATLR